MSVAPVLILPGLGGSGPLHWQSLWEAADPGCRRVEQRDWMDPWPDEWVAAVERAVRACAAPPVLVAHSLSCALVAHWNRDRGGGVAGALLVAPSDVDSPAHTSPAARRFSPMPLAALSFPSIVVASRDDPRVAPERAALFARAWGSRLVDIGAAGHINADSGLGDWPAGRRLLAELRAPR